MTRYELTWLACEPFLPVIYRNIRRDLKAALNAQGSVHLSVLDVGGRKSPYTIGLPARITILDKPQESSLQRRLHLGLTRDIAVELSQRRSNIQNVILDDFLQNTLPAGSFDAVIVVEVIEHIREDESFLAGIARVLKPGGFLYLTTPNGDYTKNEGPTCNPDHVRHYSRDQLRLLLEKHLERVSVTYGVRMGRYRYWGLAGFTVRQPARLLRGVLSNVINGLESIGLDEQPFRTAHLFALGYKSEHRSQVA